MKNKPMLFMLGEYKPFDLLKYNIDMFYGMVQHQYNDENKSNIDICDMELEFLTVHNGKCSVIANITEYQFTNCDNCSLNDAGICHEKRSSYFNKDVSGKKEKCDYFKGEQ